MPCSDETRNMLFWGTVISETMARSNAHTCSDETSKLLFCDAVRSETKPRYNMHASRRGNKQDVVFLVQLSLKLLLGLITMYCSDETSQRLCCGTVIFQTADRYNVHAWLRRNQQGVVRCRYFKNCR